MRKPVSNKMAEKHFPKDGIDMEKRSFGIFLVQGAAGNAIATYAVLVGAVFYISGPERYILVVLLPLYLLAAGILGVPMGGVVWLAGRLVRRRLGILARAAIGIFLPALIVMSLLRAFQFVVDWESFLKAISGALAYSLPATLVAGSRFNPLRSIVRGSSRDAVRRDFAGGFSFPPALLLRFGSLLGLMVTVLHLACLVSGGAPEWGIRADDEAFVATTVAIFYFAACALVCFTSPGKILVVATAVFANTPLVIWALNPDRYTRLGTGFLAFAVWVFAYVWVLLAAGRIISSENKTTQRYRRTRILPLTIWEIQIRCALNRW